MAHNIFSFVDDSGTEVFLKVQGNITIQMLLVEFENFCLGQGYRLPIDTHIGLVEDDK